MCWKYFKKKHRIAKHMKIKHKHMLVPSWRYQDSRHLLQNPKVFKNIMGFSNHAQRSTPPYYLVVDNTFHKFWGHYFVILKGILTGLKLWSPDGAREWVFRMSGHVMSCHVMSCHVPPSGGGGVDGDCQPATRDTAAGQALWGGPGQI